jgi:predicted amidohydrolase YtcJ
MAARLTAYLVAGIVGLTLVAGLIVGAQRDDDTGPIDVLIYNGRVYTGDPLAKAAEAVAIRGSRVFRVGSNREIKRLRRRATTVIDAHGGSVLPGFTDARARLAPSPSAEWPSAPSAADSVATTAADSTPGAGSSSVGSGEPAEHGLEQAIEEAHRLGITGVRTVLNDDATIAAYASLREREQLRLRLAGAVEVVPPLDEAALSRLEDLRRAHLADPLLRLDGVVISLPLTNTPAGDTTPGSASKVIVSKPRAQEQDLVETVAALDRRGFEVSLRVADEQSFEQALDTLERVGRLDTQSDPVRHRIELLRPMMLPVERLRSAGITLSLPMPMLANPAWGDEPLTSAPVLLSALAGIDVVLASDTIADPRLGLQALVAAEEADVDVKEGAIVHRARLAAAIDVLTHEPFADRDTPKPSGNRRAAIAKDGPADLVILSTDIFSLPLSKLLDAVVTTTIIDGQIVYDRAFDSSS